MAVEVEHGGDVPGRPVVCLWTPQSPSDGDIGPWRMRERKYATEMLEPDFDRDREAHAFTHKGKALWADLTQGILYCECADLLNDDDTAPAVEFTFVALPEEHRIEELEYKHRAMGAGVGDNVWFVVLESCEHPGDTTVVVKAGHEPARSRLGASSSLARPFSARLGPARWRGELEN
jgi:hypothetical protein